MEFEMNSQRQAYLDARGKIVLNACPGSGKTTSVAKKLIDLENEYLATLGKYSGVACVSFTNTAKNEINEKFTELSGRHLEFPHVVSTIDSFINQYITLPFYYLLDRDFKRPKILDSNEILDDIWRVKYQDGNGKLKDGLKRPLNDFKGNNNRSIFHSYPPSEIWLSADGSFTVKGKQPDHNKVDIQVFENYCKTVVGTRFSKGFISTGDSAYIAQYLLGKWPRIGELLSKRFPHIIVDEAQDNSAIQHAIFDKLIDQGLENIEFIGDPYQSLYEWRDAKPQLFLDKYADTNNWNGLDLTDNRRSPQRIINCFSKLRKGDDPVINSVSEEDKELPILIYKYSDSNTPQIVQHFDSQCQTNGFNNNQIVVRGNSLKNKMLGKGDEVKPWNSWIPFQLIKAMHHYKGNEIKPAVQSIRSIVAKLIEPGLEYHDFKEFERGLKVDHYFNAKLMEALHGLPSLSLSLTDWTIQTQLFIQEKFELTNQVDFQIRNRNSKYFNKIHLVQPVEQHFKRSFSDSKIPITTVHQVKGKSLDAILVFFNSSRHKDNITFGDITSNDLEFPSEKQRIIYVALSRPKHLLAMAFPESVSDQDIRTKFGDDVQIVLEGGLNAI